MKQSYVHTESMIKYLRTTGCKLKKFDPIIVRIVKINGCKKFTILK